jgi:two-component system, NtrC family, sensor kinase
VAALSNLRTRLQRLSIRDRLLALVLLPLAVVLPLLGLILLWWSNVAFERVLVTKVRADLAVAQGYFERMLAQVGSSTGAVAESHALRRALDLPERVAFLLQGYREREGLDFLVLRGADALALHRAPARRRCANIPASSCCSCRRCSA